MTLSAITRIFALCSFVFSTASICAQTGTVAGTVVDSVTNKPLEYAHVFIDNSTSGGITAGDGVFEISNLEPGQVTFVVSMVGYHRKVLTFNVSDGHTTKAIISLAPDIVALTEISVSSEIDKQWNKDFKKFERIFLGPPRILETCKIVNPWVLDFSYDGGSGALLAKAHEPLEIFNSYLGYYIRFHLQQFKGKGETFEIVGFSHFSELPDSQRVRDWKRNRQLAYEGSYQHFFRSLISGRTSQEGFRIFLERGGNRASRKSSSFYAGLGPVVKEIDGSSLLTPSPFPGEFFYSVVGNTEVHYTKEYPKRQYYSDINYQVSWIETSQENIRVNSYGLPLEKSGISFSGEMSQDRISELLPVDYDPTTGGTRQPPKPFIAPVAEAVHLQTDKQFYYPGETIWIKAYMRYSERTLVDTMSRVLYVDLYDKSNDRITTRMLKIDSGAAAGHLTLPKTMPKGGYLLRAYTTWMRNFGDTQIFQKLVPVLSTKEWPVLASQQTARDSLLSIVLSKSSYKSGDTAHLTLCIKDRYEEPLGATLSVAIVRNEFAAPLTQDAGTFPTPPGTYPYKMDVGMTLSGTLTNDKGAPLETAMMVMALQSKAAIPTQSDADGLFSIKGLEFEDSLDLVIQGLDKKGKRVGKIKLIGYDPPPIVTWPAEQEVQTRPAEINEVAIDSNSILLKPVEVSAHRVAVTVPEIQERIFGKPDDVIKAESLMTSGTTDLAVALQGKIPGYYLIRTDDGKGTHFKVALRSASSSIVLSTEPLIIIDGVPMGGSGPEGGDTGETSGDRLKLIDMTSVERVEVTKRLNNLYGEAGRNGVIAIFTKAYTTKRGNSSPFGIETVRIPGYVKQSPYPDPTQVGSNSMRPNTGTIYWNSRIKVAESSGSHIIPLRILGPPGQYVVVVEGVTTSGKAVCVKAPLLID